MARSDCYRNCWILGAIAGVIVLLFTSGIGDLGWAGGLFLGFVTFLLFGAMMVWLLCDERLEFPATRDGANATDWDRRVADRQPGALLASGPLGPEAPTSLTQMPIVAGAMPKDWSEFSAGGQKPAPKPVAAAPAPAKAEVAAAAAPQKAQPAKAAAKKAAPAKPARAKAEAVVAAPDDLRRIKGIGRKLSVWLNEQGVTRFDQIAAWDAKTEAGFARRLGNRGGRIKSDDWVGQARILAAGGETEHSRAVDRGEAT